jgi:hypothetical protein
MNFPLPTFSGIDPYYSLPNNVAVITLQVSKKKFLLKISPNKLFVMPLEDKRMHSLHCFLINLILGVEEIRDSAHEFDLYLKVCEK